MMRDDAPRRDRRSDHREDQADRVAAAAVGGRRRGGRRRQPSRSASTWWSPGSSSPRRRARREPTSRARPRGTRTPGSTDPPDDRPRPSSAAPPERRARCASCPRRRPDRRRNSASRPGARRPPVHVTVVTRDVTSAPSTRSGGSSGTVVSVWVHPATSGNPALHDVVGKLTATLTVSADADSFGTDRTTSPAVAPAVASTWALAVAVTARRVNAATTAASLATLGRSVGHQRAFLIGMDTIAAFRSNSPRRTAISNVQTPATDAWSGGAT